MNKKQSYILFIVVLVVVIAAALLFVFGFEKKPNNMLTVSFLNVGQGDAIFIEAPNKKQMLIDGGGNGTILRELGEVMPFYDRSIDIVVATHPDKDHIGGLVDVVQNFSVDNVIRSGVESDTSTYRLLDSIITRKNIDEYIAKSDMRMYLDEMYEIYVDVIYAVGDATDVKDKNDASIVVRLVYGDTEFLLTGDASVRVEKEIVQDIAKEALQSDVLKLGHHGSKTSSSLSFLETVDPELAIVSAGCDNRYGHPHSEVTARVESLGITIMETCIHDTIILKSDGVNVFVE